MNKAREQAEAWKLVFKLMIIATLVLAASSMESIVELVIMWWES